MDRTLALSRRTPEVWMLAAVHGVAGMLCLLNAAWPASRDAPVELSRVMGATGLTVAVLLWAIGSTVPAATHVALALVGGSIAVQAWQSTTAVDIVGMAPALIVVGLYAAHFFSLAAARTHVVLATTLATAGAVAAAPDGFAAPWLVAVLSAGMLTEGHARLSARLRAAASTDPLTGVANRRAWEEEANRSLAHARRSGQPLTVAVLDLDGFKQVNDREGHSAGDELLRRLTAQWSARLRRSDLLGRQGGDEFVLCLPDTDGPGALEVLDRLADGGTATWSVGAATAGVDDSLDTLLARADTALYLDKRRRRAARGLGTA